ncbi:hypothetical protein FHS59_001665 [Algoriphagus iocasae]|uniref:DUF4249 domain-containing protein n=1 Tax=Algoriphagus iocasae TaxID=1836499 RepID=A0A841MKN6_9BACT|nr:DUF4249 family protein [Algoriphagus iocasae]MBB6326037.1 hypothetical protein [Algoriphagus iocasae]
MNKFQLIRAFAAFLIFVLANSCVEQIDFPLDKGVEKLIVSGQVNNLNEPQLVFLSETTSKDREPLFEDNKNYVLNDLPRPVSGANIKLMVIYGDGFASVLYTETKAGQYEMNSGVDLESASEIYLEIEVKGKMYRSKPQTMPSVVGSDVLSYSFTRGIIEDQPETPFISIETEATLPQQTGGYYLRWDVDEAYYWNLTFFPNPFNRAPPDCYVFGYPDPERITLVNGDLLNNEGNQSKRIVAQRIIDESFLSRHYFNVRQVSTNKEAYEYWRRIKELVGNTGSVFDTPPAPVLGNLYNVNDESEIVLGYFEVAKVNLTRIYTTRADVPFFNAEVCTYSPTRPLDDYPKTCLRCSEFKNSSNDTPPWWFDQ